MHISTKTILATVLAVFSLNISAQQVWYVSAGATGAATGLDWVNAFPGLQQALAVAQAGDAVWLSEGTYRPTAGADRGASFYLPSGVSLYGGFTGSEQSLAGRDWAAHPTVLSGDIGTEGDSTDNTYNILYLDNPDSSTVVDGLRFVGGNADSTLAAPVPHSRYERGGAVYIMAEDGEAYPTFVHCHFEHNHAAKAGGAIYINATNYGSASPAYRDCVFRWNHSGQDGGAIYRYGGSWADRGIEMLHCVFEGNSAANYGGGVYHYDVNGSDQMDIRGCRFRYNSAPLGGGYGLGGGRSTGLKICMDSTAFGGNRAVNGADVNFQSVIGYGFKTIKVLECAFSKMSVDGVQFEEGYFGNTLIKGCMVTDTNVVSLGTTLTLIHSSNFCLLELLGNIFQMRYDMSLIASLFTVQNLYASGMEFAAINIYKDPDSPITSVSLENIVLISDSNTSANPFRSNALKIIVNNLVLRYNKILTGETIVPNGLEINNSYIQTGFPVFNPTSGSRVTISNSYIHGNVPCESLSPYYVTCGQGNQFGTDPGFVDAANGDFRLLPCSPLIDAGQDGAYLAQLPTDLAGSPRVRGQHVDIGAYEAAPFATAASPEVGASCPDMPSGRVGFDLVDGCAPYALQWVGGQSATPEVAGLAAGDYTFTITDHAGRAIIVPVTVPAHPAIGVQPAIGPLICGQTAGGSIALVAVGGNQPFGYAWADQPAGGSTRTGLLPGTYTVTVTDAAGCTLVQSAEIMREGQLTLQAVAEAISCYGQADGMAGVVPLNGLGPFAFAWSNGATDSALAGLDEGSYAVSVSDALGCTASFVFSMDAPDSLVAVLGSQPVTDAQTPNGTAQVALVQGGTAPYTYLWSNGSTARELTGLPTGTYLVTITDKNGCQKVYSIFVDKMIGTQAAALGLPFRLAPNPAAAQCTLSGAGLAGALLEITDVAGRPVLAELLSHDAVTLDLLAVPAGMYWVVLRKNGTVLGSRKLVVVR